MAPRSSCSMPGSEQTRDPELGSKEDSYLFNSNINHLKWTGVNVEVKDRSGKKPSSIVQDASGVVEAGEICALMGPSGCGKTTLLNVLARKKIDASRVESDIKVNGRHMSDSEFRIVSRYVEQEDANIGSLTVRETLDFSSRLASSQLSRHERHERVEALLDSFGLQEQAETLIGTAIHKGISGGEKRRLSVASQLITSPKILFLDEPTSGLDSAASWEIINYIKSTVKSQRLIVILSIHQPSAATLQQFDKLMLMSNGQTHYFGPVDEVEQYYSSIGCPAPSNVNLAEFLLERLNVNFAKDKRAAEKQAQDHQQSWERSRQKKKVEKAIRNAKNASKSEVAEESASDKPNVISVIATLLHRTLIKSFRDPMVYSARLVIYIAFAIVMGTIWLRLEPTQSSIQPFVNAMFFGSVFISFMAVSYVPAFLEDRTQYAKDHENGLYGATEFLVCNFLLGLPFLFLLSVGFSSITYWLANFQPTPSAFFTWIMWLFLELLSAESVVVLAACLFPTFVISLGAVTFANGLWISVSGFMVPLETLNAFYKYGFSSWNYQKYAFEGMMVNEFKSRVYSCGPGCHCMYNSTLADNCEMPGTAVLDNYGFNPNNNGRNIGIIVAIIIFFRLTAWIVLKLFANRAKRSTSPAYADNDDKLPL